MRVFYSFSLFRRFKAEGGNLFVRIYIVGIARHWHGQNLVYYPYRVASKLFFVAHGGAFHIHIVARVFHLVAAARAVIQGHEHHFFTHCQQFAGGVCAAP